MFHIVLTIHIVLSLGLIGLVLVQQGKGADMGAAFGSGNSNTVFGASGATSILTKATTGLVIAFMITSILLVRAYNSRGVAVKINNDLLAGSTINVEEIADTKSEETSDVAGKVSDTSATKNAAPVAAEVDNKSAKTAPVKEEAAKK